MLELDSLFDELVGGSEEAIVFVDSTAAPVDYLELSIPLVYKAKVSLNGKSIFMNLKDKASVKIPVIEAIPVAKNWISMPNSEAKAEDVLYSHNGKCYSKVIKENDRGLPFELMSIEDFLAINQEEANLDSRINKVAGGYNSESQKTSQKNYKTLLTKEKLVEQGKEVDLTNLEAEVERIQQLFESYAVCVSGSERTLVAKCAMWSYEVVFGALQANFVRLVVNKTIDLDSDEKIKNKHFSPLDLEIAVSYAKNLGDRLKAKYTQFGNDKSFEFNEIQVLNQAFFARKDSTYYKELEKEAA